MSEVVHGSSKLHYEIGEVALALIHKYGVRKVLIESPVEPMEFLKSK